MLFVYVSPKLTSDEERQSFVIAHNKYRGIVSNPYAKSMPAVVWDSFLEGEVQAYTDKCIWGHDSSRKYSVNSNHQMHTLKELQIASTEMPNTPINHNTK